MAKTGFNVTIGADTKPFETALRNLNQPIKDAQKSLQRLNDGLKINPTNVTLLTEKEKQLSYQIEDTKKKLDKLNEAYRNLQNEYLKTGSFTEEQERTFHKLNGEIAVTEQELKQLQDEYNKFGSVGLQQAKAIGSQMEDLGSKIQSVGAKLSIVSGAVAGLFGVGINYNMEIEKATKAFETFTGSAEEAQEIIGNIKADSKQSLFDTKELINANKLLVTAGVDADKARDTINGLADAIALTGGGNDELNRMAYNLQQVQNVGKASALDIKQFALAGVDVYGMLGDYLDKTTQEIKNMDISFEDLSGALIKASSEGGKYFKGQETMANTTSGQVVVMKKKFEETLGVLSEKLMPIITKIMEKVIGFLDKLNANPALMDLITNVGIFLVVLGPLVTTLGTVMKYGGIILKNLPSMTQLTTGLSKVIGALTSPIGLVVGAIVGLIAVFKHLYDTNEEFRNKANEAWETLVQVFQEHILPVIQQAGELIGNVLNTIWETIQAIWGVIEPFIQKIFEEVMAWWNETGSDMLAMLFDILGELLSAVNWLWQNVIDPIIKFVNAILMPVLQVAFQVIGDLVHALFYAISSVWNNIKGILQGIIDFVAGIFTGNWERAWEGVKGIFTGIWNTMGNIVKTIINGMIAPINMILRGLNNIKLPDFLGGGGINIPLIPTLAKGGIVDKATLAMIGEGSSAEAVMPLDKLPSLMAEAIKEVGGSNITLQFYPQQMTEGELEQAFNYVNRRFGTAY